MSISVGNTRRYAAFLVVCGVAGLAAVLFIAARNYHAIRSLLTADPPSALLASPERTGVAGLTSVTFIAPGNLKLAAWYVASTNGAAVIVVNGTNSDRSSLLPELRLLVDAGYGVLAFDWPGLGHSEGRVQWGAQARNALSAAIDWLALRPDVDPRHIGGLGFSIGGYVMAQVAAVDQRLRAVVLEAPPSSFEDYIDLHDSRWGLVSSWPAHLAMRDSGLLEPGFAAVKLVNRIAPRPVLILVGSRDGEVSPAMVMKVYDAARDPKTLWVVDGAVHGNYADVAAAEYTRRITEFFARSLSPLPRSSHAATTCPSRTRMHRIEMPSSAS